MLLLHTLRVVLPLYRCLVITAFSHIIINNNNNNIIIGILIIVVIVFAGTMLLLLLLVLSLRFGLKTSVAAKWGRRR